MTREIKEGDDLGNGLIAVKRADAMPWHGMDSANYYHEVRRHAAGGSAIALAELNRLQTYQYMDAEKARATPEG